MKFPFSFLLFLPALSACSIYQSEGRKFLENQAFTYSGASAVGFLRACQNVAASDGRLLVMDERALVYEGEATPLEIRIVRRGGEPFSCDYGFTTQDELNQTLSSAIDLTLYQGQNPPPPSTR